jgi:hypothetical protein
MCQSCGVRDRTCPMQRGPGAYIGPRLANPLWFAEGYGPRTAVAVICRTTARAFSHGLARSAFAWLGRVFDQVGEAVLRLRAYFVIAQAAWLACWRILYLVAGAEEWKNKVIWVKAVFWWAKWRFILIRPLDTLSPIPTIPRSLFPRQTEPRCTQFLKTAERSSKSPRVI